MALVAQYRAFKADLQGYVEVPFDEFRGRLVPLRKALRTAWAGEDDAYVRGLAEAGAAFALQRFFGLKHKAASKVLGAVELDPEPLAKAELDDHMRALVKNCRTAGWPPERFAAFVRYLGSSMTPKELDDQERAATAGALYQLAAETRAAAEEPPQRDRFAEMYRAAGPAFRRVVDGHLAEKQ